MILQMFSLPKRNPAGLILADRDGTLIQDEGYFHDATKMKFLDFDMDVFSRIKQESYGLFVVSNQSGIARGYFDMTTAMRVNTELANRIKELGGNLSGVIFCPHSPKDFCFCRKPKSSMLSFVQDSFAGTSKKVGFFGNSDSDRKAASHLDIYYRDVNNSNFSKEVYDFIFKNN